MGRPTAGDIRLRRTLACTWSLRIRRYMPTTSVHMTPPYSLSPPPMSALLPSADDPPGGHTAVATSANPGYAPCMRSRGQRRLPKPLPRRERDLCNKAPVILTRSVSARSTGAEVSQGGRLLSRSGLNSVIDRASELILKKIEDLAPLWETIQTRATRARSRSSACYPDHSNLREPAEHNQKQESGGEMYSL